MKIIPHNPVYRAIILFLPWQWGKTYIEIKDNVIIFRRYYCFDGKSMKKDILIFNINQIKRIGFPEDLNIKMQEKMLAGSRGVYFSQEIDFEGQVE